ncbi:MAG TPA: 2-C-methyl-D-erythritol 4-phosphate cytidylyltransferase [Ktedonobacteraceae bacterium]|jgi:2-C-methyl-D-erythritol 4-phosphate cytidylyltransferase|nr:2-C-methyl-D-erythritol 4-phosphate cytidylyltransferase [Ktedonobacteraceae bacterium]
MTMQDRVAAVIVAAGSSRRMEGHDKLWIPLAGRITLARTIDVFEASTVIDAIVLVLSKERIAEAERLCRQEGWRKIAGIVPGGMRRQDSVRAGLDTLARMMEGPPYTGRDQSDLPSKEGEPQGVPQCDWVMIHDGARPLVSPAILEAGLRAAQEYGAAIAGMPVKDTIKQVRQGIVHTTFDRSQLWAVQTPQVFSFQLIYAAHHAPEAEQDVTDDAALLERLGQPVAIFPGAYTNIKITTVEDLTIAEALLRRRDAMDGEMQ